MNISRDTLNDIKNSMPFNERQLGLIDDGAQIGLSETQIRFYATTIFEYEQMHQIYLGFKNRLTMEEVKLYGNSGVSFTKMKQIRIGLEHGLGDAVKLYRELDNSGKMRSVRLLLERGLHPDYLVLLYGMGYSNKQILIVGLGIMSGLNTEDLRKFTLHEKECNSLYHMFSYSVGSKDTDTDIIKDNFKNAFNTYNNRFIDEIKSKW